jgi:hypothetical protein
MRSQNTLVSRQVSGITMRLSCPWPCFDVPMFRFRRPGFQPDLCIASPPETRVPSTSAAPTTPRCSIAEPVPALYTGSIVGYVSQVVRTITPGSWDGWSRPMWPFAQPDKKVMALRPTPPYRPAHERAPCSFSRRDSTGL